MQKLVGFMPQSLQEIVADVNALLSSGMLAGTHPTFHYL